RGPSRSRRCANRGLGGSYGCRPCRHAESPRSAARTTWDRQVASPSPLRLAKVSAARGSDDRGRGAAQPVGQTDWAGTHVQAVWPNGSLSTTLTPAIVPVSVRLISSTAVVPTLPAAFRAPFAAADAAAAVSTPISLAPAIAPSTAPLAVIPRLP